MSMSSSNTDTDTITICAACGKEGDDLKVCTACHMVKYCNRDCQISHRKQHKNACKKRAAEINDEKLFREVEPEDCPICFLPMPLSASDSKSESCCGKRICDGCIYAMRMSGGKNICVFCRTPNASSDEEHIKRVKKLMDKGNAEAFHLLAGVYATGINGIPQDWMKANELNLKAGELGCARGYFQLGVIYNSGTGAEVNKEKSTYYWELAAMNGYIIARHNLGVSEGQAGNHQRAQKHFILAARAGHDDSLDIVKQMFKEGFAMEDEYASTLCAYQKIQDEMKSDERDRAASEMQD